MRQYFYLHAVNHEGSTLTRWFIEHSEEQWKLTCDAAGASPFIMQPFETAKGRHEMVALFLTPAMFEAVRGRLPEFFGTACMAAPPARVVKHGFPRLTPSQRESCHLKLMHFKDKEIDDRQGYCPGATKQAFYRLRKTHRVNSTPELFLRLRALREL